MSCSCTPQTNDLSASVMEKINNHPCYSQQAHQHYARIHVAVAPACNIQCNYCNRKYDCSNESRPGVTSSKLSPEEAVKKVLYVGGEIKQLSVVGIAGPGDALANPKKTFDTFAMLQKYAPDLKLCLSTNGLKIAEHIDKIKKYNIDHVTVTINSVDETGQIGAKIYPWVHHNHKKIKGKEGAKILLQKQLEGIKLLVKEGILVKANSVLIPGVNEHHLAEVSKKLKEMNVFLHNIMPLISDPSHGTKFGLEGVPSASDADVMAAQEACGMDMNLMKHCRQCRADAVGLLGEDRSDEFTKERFAPLGFDELETIYDLKGRRQTHENIRQWQETLAKANERVSTREEGQSRLVAVTTAGGGLINTHFGSATEFLIYRANETGIEFVMHRKIEDPYCSGEENCDSSNPIEHIKQTLKDCDLLLTERIGDCPMQELDQIGLLCDESYAREPIETSVFEAVKKHFGKKAAVG